MNDLETVWQELLTSALLGTERHPPMLPTANGAFTNFLARLDSIDPQHFLLQAAGAAALYRKAGRLPVRLPLSVIPACEPDEQPRCSPAAAARLATLLGGSYKDLIPEWLTRAAAAQKRVPEELLPELLNWAESHLDQVDLVLPVLGKRGRWLAKQIPWGEGIGAAVFAETIPAEAAQTVWQTGRKSARRLLLRKLRETDPALALSLVSSTWSEESAEERGDFLKILENGLSMADEPFLEEALDDRSKEVRRAAADLLARLPVSRLVQRQLERGQEYLKWKPGSFLRKAQIDVALPETCDKSMLRDGVEPKRPVKSRGEKADWLVQILSTVPPSIWSRRWGKTSVELLDISAEGDWKEILHQSWITAAGNHPDPDWAEAILKIYPGHGLLLEALPAGRRVSFLSAQIKSRIVEGMELLLGCHEPWGMELSSLALHHLRNYYVKSEAASSQASLRASFLLVGRYLDPSLAFEANRQLVNKAKPGSVWEKEVERLLQILDFRHHMMEELR